MSTFKVPDRKVSPSWTLRSLLPPRPEWLLVFSPFLCSQMSHSLGSFSPWLLPLRDMSSHSVVPYSSSPHHNIWLSACSTVIDPFTCLRWGLGASQLGQPHTHYVSFLFMLEWYSVVWIYHVYSSTSLMAIGWFPPFGYCEECCCEYPWKFLFEWKLSPFSILWVIW